MPLLASAAPGTAVMARNFAIVYLEQAVGRAAPEERFTQARPSLLPWPNAACWLAVVNRGMCIGRPLTCGCCVVHGCLLRDALHISRQLLSCSGTLAITQSQLATLLTGLSTRPAQHQQMLLRMAAQVERMGDWGSRAA